MWEKYPVRVSAVGDVIKVWVWAVGSLVVGLWLTPVAYNGGKALSELSATKDFNGVVNKFAAWSGAAGLEDFFRICWPLAALVSLFQLIEWLRLGGSGGGRGPWGVRLPHVASLGKEVGQPLKPNRWGLLMGWLLADRLFSKATQSAEIPDRIAGYLTSGSVQTGLIPLLGVLAVGGLVHLITHGYRHRRNACD